MIALLFAGFAFAGELDGIWLQDCARSYQREEIISAGQAEYRELNYSDTACKHATLETISRGTITLGEPVAKPVGAREIDFVFTSVAIKPRTAAVAERYRERRLCGFTDWALNEERDVTGRECDFFGLNSVVKVPAAGELRYGVVKQNGQEELFFGQLTPSRNGSARELRPQELDSRPYRFLPLRR